MPRQYRYVGPPEILARSRMNPKGVPLHCAADLREWVQNSGQKPDTGVLIVATFIVDLDGCLRIADRRSEHVTCAGGQPVLSAGEISFRCEVDPMEAVEVSNQSTGFCPEPESWPHVAMALVRIPVLHPGKFTQEIVFRRCPSCGQINIVKDGWFVCSICGSSLPSRWNLA